jgi:hypothetical protein
MKLYHFTSDELVDQIMAEGLKPSSHPDAGPPDGVVWLTTSEVGNWLIDPRQKTCRLWLSIPNGALQLVKFEPYIKKTYPYAYEKLLADGFIASQDALDTTWIYRGTIPPSAVREILKGLTYDITVVNDAGRTLPQVDARYRGHRPHLR